ncbi:uncharacterized protein K02A2.6-like [Frankliniella occidentalis]|uniref:RNA-directed DNA polymerase n=1 Tax=Frankliniella occidentalis TaxID=133901 RepID=A0A6J1T137_FRAOC|nr:uncharacterized protein K02A2.6-like [Frankliniella occidentalis]
MPATHVYGMMHNVPPTLSFTGNVAKNYRDWKKIFDNYMRATKQINDKDEDKIATLLNVAGNEAILKQEKILKGLSEEDQKDYGKVVGALKKYCDSLYEYNETYERFIFSRRDQQEGESFDSFYQAIQELVVSCNYPDQSKQLRDRIVQGTRDKSLQESLLRIKNLTEDVAAQQARSAETSRNQVLAMARCSAGESLSNEATVDSMKTKNQRGWNNPKQKTNPRANPNPNPQPKMTPNPTDEQPRGKFRCIKCDTHHPKFKCPAYGQTCGNCGRLNHLTKCCRVEIKQVAELKTNESDEDIVVLHHLKSLDTATEWRELIKIGNKQIVLKLDPGSDVNTLTWDFVKTLKEKENMRPCKTLIAPYGTSSPPIKAAGKLLVNVEVRGKQYMLDFLVVDDDVTPVLSKTDCERMGLVIRVHEVKTTTPQTKEEFVNSHKDSFQGTGKFPGKLKIVLQEGCKPKRSIPHRIPSAIKDKLKEALDDQEARGIIRKVQEITPATVINNLVITEKPDKSLRICLDPSELNKVILSRPHQVPTTLEIQEKLSGMKVFSVLDLKEGFYHCELDEESQMLCCFVTPWGIYCFQRLPFGLTSAPEEFQAINEAIFGDIEGVVVYIDDICCAGKNQAQHDKSLNEIMKRAKENNIRFKEEKFQYSQNKIKYVGQIFSSEGVEPDPERIEALINMPTPQSKENLETALGMFNYVRQYIPNMSEFESTLRELTKKDRQWVWLPDHETAFENLKQKLAEVTTLHHFDPKKTLELQCDASKVGVGACLMQEKKPIAWASRSMNSAERNYSQSEKEMLSITFGFKKFHNLVYGRKVKVFTDHKSLVPIMNKNISSIGSDRLKRLRLKILKYKFEIEYLPGTSMHMADHLSRNFLPETEVEDPEMVEVVHSLTRKLPVSKSYLDKLLAATENDLVIKQVIKYVMEGWPKQISKVPQEVKPFWQHQHDLYVLQGVLMKDHCIVIPKNLQKETVNQLHEGHAPSEKTIKRAKMSVYWPNFVRDITNFVDSCTVCGKFKPRKTPVELLQHEIPDLPWAKLGADLLSFGGKKYLIVMDYFSKWLEIIPVKSLSAAAVIEALKSIFFIHGDPQSIVCDNNPFNSNEFQLFAKDKFDLIFSSPTYAQSNGLAECAVGIAKKIMRKSHESKEDYRILLREQNSNPLSGMEHSPAQILYSRQIKTNIPTSRKTLEPKLVQKEAHKKMIENQQVRKTSHDKRVGRKPQIFKSGQSVNIRNRHETTWTPGTVIGQHQNPRSYLVKNSRGNIVRRNERHLSNAPSKLEYQSDYSDISSVVVPQDQPKFDVVNPMPVIQETPHCEVVTEFALIVPDYFYQMQQ